MLKIQKLIKKNEYIDTCKSKIEVKYNPIKVKYIIK